MGSCNIFAQPVSPQEFYQIKSYTLNSLFLIATLFHSMDIPQFTHMFSWCTLRLLPDSPLLATLQYRSLIVLLYVPVLSFNRTVRFLWLIFHVFICHLEFLFCKFPVHTCCHSSFTFLINLLRTLYILCIIPFFCFMHDIFPRPINDISYFTVSLSYKIFNFNEVKYIIFSFRFQISCFTWFPLPQGYINIS